MDEQEQSLRVQLEQDSEFLSHGLQQLKGYCESVCYKLAGDGSVRLRAIEQRLKSPASVLRKLRDKNCAFSLAYDCVGDLLGVRIVVYNLSDVAHVATALSTDTNSPLASSEVEEVDRNGYRATHVNGRLGKFGCEIQIRTVVQDAWAVTSRADVYHSLGDNPLVDRLAVAQAKVLGGVDEVLQAVRDLTQGPPSDPRPVARVLLVEPVPVPSIPLDQAKLRQAEEALSPDDRAILASPLSEERIRELFAAIDSARQGSTVRKLFRAAGKYRRKFAFLPDRRYGFTLRSYKGPFVERSSWATGNTSELGRALERYLEGLLAVAIGAPESSVAGDWPSVKRFGDEVWESKRLRNLDLMVLTGKVPDTISLELLRDLDFRGSANVRDQPVHDLEVVMGGLPFGIPLLRIRDPELEPAVCFVDLDGFTYEQFNGDTASNADLGLELKLIDEPRAIAELQARPELSAELYRANRGEEGSYTPEETVVQLQLRVLLEVTEAGHILASPGHAAVARIEPT